jgi:hypothetical protein
VREAEIAELNQSIAERDADVYLLNHELVALYSSTSWKVTKPLRYVKNVINGNLNHDQVAKQTSLKLIWEDDLHLKINDIRFNLSFDTEQLKTGNSKEDSFLLGKPKHMVEKSLAIGKRQKISRIFEMGRLHGGSVVLYDQMFDLEKIVAIDHEPKPVEVLAGYIKKHSKSHVIKPYYGINQADRRAMKTILSDEFPNRDIDLIIDDASHLYDETREAFNISFPYLKADGLYVIEDWAWAHWSGEHWQKDNAYFKERRALSNLLIELFMLAASKPDYIKDIFIDHNQIIVKRGEGILPWGEFNIGDHYLLRGKQFDAWL